MNNKFQLIIVQNMDSYGIEVVFVAPKSLESKEVRDYIFEVAEEYDGDVDTIVNLVTEKFGIQEISHCELFA